MLLSCVNFVYASSTNSVSIQKMRVERSKVLYSDGPQRLIIQPRSEIGYDESIILSVEYAKFNKELVEASKISLANLNGITGIEDGIDNPFIYRSKKTGTTYDKIQRELFTSGFAINDTLKKYVGDEGSRELPYGFKWISENELQVNLFPIPDSKVNQNNSDVTKGTPVYSIALPIVTDSEYLGSAYVTIDDNGSTITGGQTLKLADVVEDVNYDPTYDHITDYSPVNNIYAERVVNALEGQKITYNNEPNKLYIKPLREVCEDDYIIITIKNGKFDELMANECQFLTEKTDNTYNDIVGSGLSSYDALIKYIGNENSRQLPYKIEFINSEIIKVKLFPIPDSKVNQNNEDVTQGLPVYGIKLPVVAGNEKGVTEVAVDARKTENMQSGGWYTIANVGGYVDENYKPNQNMFTEREVIASPSEPILYNGNPNTLFIKPTAEVYRGDTIFLKVKNGSFDKSMVEQCQFKTEKFNCTYDEIVNTGLDYNVSLMKFVGDENSRRLPYKLEYISSDTLKVELYPVNDVYVEQNNYNVVSGLPLYAIKLPLIAGNETGYTEIAVDGQQTSIKSGGYYSVARINSESSLSAGAASIGIYSVNSVNKGEPLSGAYRSAGLQIMPIVGVSKGESILISIKNGYFDKDLIEELKFKSEKSGTTYDEIVASGLSSYDALTKYVGNENSRCLPYKVEYVSDDIIRVELYPIDDCKVNQNNSNVTQGTPIYEIKLPAVAGNDEGSVTVSVDGNESVIPSSGDLTIGYVLSAKYGDADGNGIVDTQDVSLILQRVLSGNRVAIEDKVSNGVKYIDVDGDGKITSADVAAVLQKVLDSSYKFDVEMTDNM